MKQSTAKLIMKQNKKPMKKTMKKNMKNILTMEKKITPGKPLIEVIRNGMVESLHSGHLLIINQYGKIISSLGKHNFLMYPRSSIKAIQTAAMIRHGLNVNDDLLALASSSHIGTQLHQNKVKELLSTAGLDESFLQNTPSLPKVNVDSAKPTSLAAECSGKHAGMLVTSKLNNWNLKTYKNPQHPMQVACKKELEMLSQERISKIAVDGCGAPLFAITLRGLARAIHNLMVSQDPVHQRVVNACKKYPEMVSGEGTFPTVAMQQIPDIFVKSGAEGVLVAGFPNGSTIVCKISDGSDRGERELLSAALKKIGIKANLYTPENLGNVIRAVTL